MREYAEEIDRSGSVYTAREGFVRSMERAMRIRYQPRKPERQDHEPLWRYGRGMVESAMEFLRIARERLPQYRAEHEEQQPSGDGLCIPLTHSPYDVRIR